MPSIDNHIDKIFIDKDTYLFSRGERWSVRRNLPGQPPFIRALKIRSNVDEKTNYKAIAKAQSLLDEATERLALDLPINVLTVERLAAEFLKQGEEGVRINEEAGKIISYLNISPGPNRQRGAWTDQAYKQHKLYIQKIILPFWTKSKYRRKPITHITQMDVNAWESWRTIEFPEYSPSTIKHINTTFRHLFTLAQHMGERFVPPIIADPSQDLRERRRPMIDDDKYDQILDYFRDKYEETDVQGTPIWGYKQKLAYLHYQYIELINHTGIRPFSSVKNAIRLEDIKMERDESGELYIRINRREKNKRYKALGAPYLEKILKRLEYFYEQEGLSDREYLFVHFIDIPGNNIHKGKPIKSFRTQWEKCVDHYGWNDDKTEQKDRITKYGIRHRCITRRLIQNKWTPKELAEFHGNSIKMIDEIYTHLKSEDLYPKLFKLDYESDRWIEIFDSKTGALWRQVEKNSEAHHKFYKQYPNSVPTPPDPDIVLPNDATFARWTRHQENAIEKAKK